MNGESAGGALVPSPGPDDWSNAFHAMSLHARGGDAKARAVLAPVVDDLDRLHEGDKRQTLPAWRWEEGSGGDGSPVHRFRRRRHRLRLAGVSSVSFAGSFLRSANRSG